MKSYINQLVSTMDIGVNPVKVYIAFRLYQFNNEEIINARKDISITGKELEYLCSVIYECVANLQDSNTYYVDECIKSLLSLIEDGYLVHDITSRNVLALI